VLLLVLLPLIIAVKMFVIISDFSKATVKRILKLGAGMRFFAMLLLLLLVLLMLPRHFPLPRRVTRFQTWMLLTAAAEPSWTSPR
jgi:hypothetical protein